MPTGKPGPNRDHVFLSLWEITMVLAPQTLANTTHPPAVDGAGEISIDILPTGVDLPRWPTSGPISLA